MTTSSGKNAIVVSLTGGSAVFENGLENFVTLSNANAVLLITDSGISGEVSVDTSFSLGDLGDSLMSSIGLSGSFSLEFNTDSDAVVESFTANEVSYDFDLPAGLYAVLRGDNITLSLTASGAVPGVDQVPGISGDIAVGVYSNGDLFLELNDVSFTGFSSGDTNNQPIQIDNISGTLNLVSGNLVG